MGERESQVRHRDRVAAAGRHRDRGGCGRADECTRGRCVHGLWRGDGGVSVAGRCAGPAGDSGREVVRVDRGSGEGGERQVPSGCGPVWVLQGWQERTLL